MTTDELNNLRSITLCGADTQEWMDNAIEWGAAEIERLRAELAKARTELAATIRAKQENDERFALERDQARIERDQLETELANTSKFWNAAADTSADLKAERDELAAKVEQMRVEHQRDTDVIAALYDAGVVNWEGYELAMESIYE